MADVQTMDRNMSLLTELGFYSECDYKDVTPDGVQSR
jgi:hypothetical protein